MDSDDVYADRTSSRIASELSKTVNGDNARRPVWLGLVPAFIPRNTFTPEELKIIGRFIDLVPQYDRIFGPRDSTGSAAQAVAANLHMILTSAGSAEHPVGFGRSPLLRLAEDEAKMLTESIYGDIGGVLVPKLVCAPGENPVPNPLLEQIALHWTGLRMTHLKSCSAQAFAQDNASGVRPGVVLLGFGADRAHVAVEAARLGLVNHLIVGSDLATAIDDLL